MLNKLSAKLAMRLVKNKIISKKVFDVYVYGFELLLSFMSSTLIILSIGAFFSYIIETIVFLIIFILLRSFSGGYHALTYSFCTFVTLVVYGISMLLSRYFFVNHIAFFIVLPVGISILLIVAPMKNPNKEISINKSIQHKITSILLFVVFCMIGMTLLEQYPIICNTIFYTLCADILLLFPKNLNKKKKGVPANVNH